MSEIVSIADLLSKPDGDYPTGRILSNFEHEGNIIFRDHPETVVIKNHQFIGFRHPRGYLVPVPAEPDGDFDVPPLPPFGD